MTIKKFQTTIWDYYEKNKRAMPWRETRDSYRILVSEIMLQQTQVDRVRGFYEKFIKKFPSFRSLAEAKTSDVLQAWQGLGYNRRALALQKLSQAIIHDHKGKLPRDRMALEELPGIGPGTSGSLMAFVYNEPVIFIETNIRRVFIHFFFADRGGVSDDEIRLLVARTLDTARPREWYWALMDYGSYLATDLRSKKIKNPNLKSSHYMQQPAFKGSDREIRGKILKLLLSRKRVTLADLGGLMPATSERIERIVDMLAREGFLIKNNKYIEIAR